MYMHKGNFINCYLYLSVHVAFTKSMNFMGDATLTANRKKNRYIHAVSRAGFLNKISNLEINEKVCI